jgi:hypothetical protein
MKTHKDKFCLMQTLLLTHQNNHRQISIHKITLLVLKKLKFLKH